MDTSWPKFSLSYFRDTTSDVKCVWLPLTLEFAKSSEKVGVVHGPGVQCTGGAVSLGYAFVTRLLLMAVLWTVTNELNLIEFDSAWIFGVGRYSGIVKVVWDVIFRCKHAAKFFFHCIQIITQHTVIATYSPSFSPQLLSNGEFVYDYEVAYLMSVHSDV